MAPANRRRVARRMPTCEVNRRAAEVARSVAEPRGLLVAGDLGPTGELLAPLGTMTPEEARAIFAEVGSSKKAPVTPSTTVSRYPPSRRATVGTPKAAASSGERP